MDRTLDFGGSPGIVQDIDLNNKYLLLFAIINIYELRDFDFINRICDGWKCSQGDIQF